MRERIHHDIADLKDQLRVTRLLLTEFLDHISVRVDYVSVVDAETLEKLDKIDERPILIAVAAFVGKTRLIDNTMLNKAKKDAAASKA